MHYSDEAMATMSKWITSEWHMIEDENAIPPTRKPRTKTGRDLPVAVKPPKKVHNQTVDTLP